MATAFLKRALKHWIYAADGAAFVSRFERTKRLRRVPAVSLSHDGKLFTVEDKDGAISVARKSRLSKQYRNGIKARQKRLLDEYCVSDALLEEGDVVIDCGANIGEFSIICANAGATVFAFEPDRVEFEALKRNADGKSVEPFQIALWNENGTTDFFDNNDSGDSSVFNTGQSSGSYVVETQRLDDFEKLPKGAIKIIKLEAEGAEPEILEGMRETLNRTRFVTVDMGPERGLAQDNTVVECVTFLSEAGFHIRSFYHERYTALFEKET